MDPITHTLSGVLVAQLLPLGEHRAAATAVLALAANLPDADACLRRMRSTATIEYHHSLTHSLVSMAALSGLFALVCAPVTGLTFRAAFGLSCLGCLVHIALDLPIHTFRIPLLFPLTKRRFGTGLLIGLNPTTTSARCGERSLWICARCQLHSATLNPILLLLASALVVGLAAGRLRLFSAIGLALAASHLGLAALLRRIAKGVFREEIRALGFSPATLNVYPASFLPFEWLLVAEQDGSYRVGRLNLLSPSLPIPFAEFAGRSADPLAQASLGTETMRAFLGRTFHPAVSVETNERGTLVKWRDLAYALDPRIDLYTVRLQYSEDGVLSSEEFRERW